MNNDDKKTEPRSIYGLKIVHDEKTYHNTKLLLDLYSKVMWRMNNSIMELNMECYECGRSSLYDVVDILIEVDPRVDRIRIESRLESIEHSKSILELLDRATLLLKKYPKVGEKYYTIIYHCFLKFDKASETEMLNILNVTRTTFYRDKKKATNLLSVILWGFIIPDIRRGK